MAEGLSDTNQGHEKENKVTHTCTCCSFYLEDSLCHLQIDRHFRLATSSLFPSAPRKDLKQKHSNSNEHIQHEDLGF